MNDRYTSDDFFFMAAEIRRLNDRVRMLTFFLCATGGGLLGHVFLFPLLGGR